MSTLINSSISTTSSLLPSSNNLKGPTAPKKEAPSNPQSLNPVSTVELSEKAQALASSTLDKEEIGKLLTLTSPSPSTETIKPSKTGLDAYLALNKNKLY